MLNTLTLIRSILMIVYAVLFGMAGTAFANTPIPETDKPIRIIVNNWTSQIVLSKALGVIYQNLGYRVEYVEVDTKTQWSRLHRGFEHIQVEVWEGTMAEDFNRVLQFGQIVDAGNHPAVTREEWWYPSYIEEICPALPDWRGLKDCAELFASETTKPSGRYVAGPWEKPERARIRALEMDFKVEPVGRADDLWIELDKAYREKQPIVLFNWSPNWVEARYDGKFVEFPEYAPECEKDPTWGENPQRIHDCGNPKNGWLKKVAWAGVEKQWPCAMRILRDMELTNAMISSAAAFVDADGMSHDEAAEKWLSDNKDIWQNWGKTQCRS